MEGLDIESRAVETTSVEGSGVLTESAIWYREGGPIWRAHDFEGCPSFYPVYRCGDLYSYSPLPLILHKRVLRLNTEYAATVEKPRFLYASGRSTIDREIERIGGPLVCTPQIRDADELAQRLAQALRADVEAVETAHPDHVNAVLCDGRDSLLLLLLPWRNPTFVLSAPPNYELVRAFVKRHDLPYPVVELTDAPDDETHQREVVANCCRLNLEHCRWGVDLRRISQSHRHKIVFWKGQLADLYLTPSWKKVTSPPTTPATYPLKAYARLDWLVPAAVRLPLAHSRSSRTFIESCGGEARCGRVLICRCCDR
jgi:hypothetical protein